MNRTRTIVNLFVVLAFAVCTVSAQGASKVSARKAKSFIKQLEKEHQASWEQMKEKLSARPKTWVQPENKDTECKVLALGNESDFQNVKVYWDGECKEGYAAGLGRAFLDSTSGLVAWLEEYREPRKFPNNFYFHLYDSKETTVGFGDSRDTSPLLITGTSWQFSDDISNANFEVRQSYFDPETGYYFYLLSNTSYDGVLKGLKYANGKGFLVKTLLDPTQPGAWEAYFFDEKNAPSGYDIAIWRSGQVKHFEYKNGVPSEVKLPSELVEHFASLEREIDSKIALAESNFRKGEVALQVYKRRTCSGELNVDFMDNMLYGQICLEHGDFTPYIDEIEELQAQAQQRLESKAQLARNQAQIDANSQAALAQQQRAQRAQEWEYAQRAISNAQQQSQQLFNNSINGLNNFSLPNVGSFDGNQSQRNTSVCHVIGKIVTCN